MSYHYLPHPTHLTSRAALSQEDESRDILSSHYETESDPEVQRLHNIVRRSLGNFEVGLSKSGNTPMEVVLEPTEIPFRLISLSLPPRLINIVPAGHASVRHERPAEDTVDEARLRQMRSQEAAVDTGWIFACTHAYKHKTSSFHEILTPVITGTNPSHLPSLLVTKCHRSAILSAPQADENETELGHIKCCPLIPLTDQSLSDKTHRKKKRRHRARDHPRPSPAFFRPMEEWGGKSIGYAMGWWGSRPINRPESRQYARDNMRDGRLRQPD